MKKGISLIVLVITIVIIIILAGAVILNLAGSNPMSDAKSAAVLSEQSDINDAIIMYSSSVMAKQYDVVTYTVKADATAVPSTAKDAADNEIGDGYYKLDDITATCGTAFEEKTFPGSVTDLLTTISVKNARYAKNSAWVVVMNESGNVKLVKASSIEAE